MVEHPKCARCGLTITQFHVCPVRETPLERQHRDLSPIPLYPSESPTHPAAPRAGGETPDIAALKSRDAWRDWAYHIAECLDCADTGGCEKGANLHQAAMDADKALIAVQVKSVEDARAPRMPTRKEYWAALKAECEQLRASLLERHRDGERWQQLDATKEG